jgi:hypothetical protein
MKTHMARMTAGLLLAAGVALFASPGVATGTPFDALNGSWGGAGSLAFENGRAENLECLGYYKSSGGGNTLSIAIRCNGEPSKLELRTKLEYVGGKVSGSWEERTYNASGSASGLATENSLRVQFSGSLSGSMSIAFSPSIQSILVSISTTSSGLKGAHVSLSRR